MLADPHESRRVGELEHELTENGFQRPVVIEREAWWSPRWQVCDGVHRSLAAMRLGVPIPVRIGYDTSAVYDHSDLYRVTASGDITHGGDLIDAVVALASFRCSDGPWIQSDGAFGVANGPVNLHLPRHPELRLRIATDLEARLREAGIEADVEFLGNRDDR
jgi:hypothetical protein